MMAISTGYSSTRVPIARAMVVSSRGYSSLEPSLPWRVAVDLSRPSSNTPYTSL